MKKFFRLLRLLIINGLVLLLILAIVDPFLGEKVEERSELKRMVDLREHEPNSDKNYTPFKSYIEKSEGLVSAPYRLRTDSNGFIKGDDAKETRYDIVFFGGSTTECMYMEENLRFPYQVGKRLAQVETGAPIVTANGGVSGNHAMHSTVNLLAKGVPLSPRLVVFMHNINDLAMLLKTKSYWQAPENRALVKSKTQKINEQFSFIQRAKKWVKSGLEFLIPNMYKRLKNMSSGASHVVVDEFKEFRSPGKSTPNFSAIRKQYRNAVQQFVSTARNFDMEVVLMTQFNRFNLEDVFIKNTYELVDNPVDYDTFCEYYNAFNEEVRSIADQEGVFLIDLEELVASDKRYIYDAVHLNPNGSDLVAQLIAERLAERYPNWLKVK